ncbi:MAG: ribosome biogenesis GTPase Der [Coriobacteriia bacterium]
MTLPIVAVVGRPNVGKSTFVNRIIQTQNAIVHQQSGVTRDRSYHRADWNGREFMLVDTGGIEFATDDAFGSSIRQQAEVAAAEADLVIFLVDGSVGIAPGDQEVANLLRRHKTPVFLVVNKLDTPGREEAAHEFWALGLDTPWPVSATHGHGTGDLLDALVDALPESAAEEGGADEIGVAIIGKPNAGKSSLYNRLLGEERAIVSDVAGTTRDAIDTLLDHGEQHFRLVDTAGLRRKSQIDESVEYYGFVRAMRAIDRADVAVLVIDAETGVTDQDQRVARFAEDRGCGIVVALNKWDLLASPEAKTEIVARLPEKLGFISYAPVVRVSALTGTGVHKVLPMVSSVYTSCTRQIPTNKLNSLLTELRATGHTISKGGRILRLQYVTQTGTKPPVFTFFANHPRMVDPNYERYLENRLRESFDLVGTPVRLRFRQKG